MLIGDPSISMPGIFIGGCNLKCPYCVNRSIIGDGMGRLDALSTVNELMAAMEPWVFVSGGEPLNNRNTPNLLWEIKQRRMKIALLTNGTFPGKLRDILLDGLVDYVVMDVKTSFGNLERYMEACGTSDAEVVDKVRKSVEVVKKYGVGEFRTICCSRYVDLADVKEIAREIGRHFPFVLQFYSSNQMYKDGVEPKSFAVSSDELKKWAAEVSGMVKWVSVREV
jgi:pyruvate formate lyase activating enzyme